MSTQEEFQGCPEGGCEGCPMAGGCGGCPGAANGGCAGCPMAGGCGCGGCGCGCGGEDETYNAYNPSNINPEDIECDCPECRAEAEAEAEAQAQAQAQAEGCPEGGCEGCPMAGGCAGCPGAAKQGCGEEGCGCGCGGCAAANTQNQEVQVEEKEVQEEEKEVESQEVEAPYPTYGTDDNGYILLTEDGGVKKKIIKEGTGDLPPAGSKVTVHYDGYLYPSGEEFDSSRKRHSPFTFNLSKGEVIKAWDIGIATIRRGEQASLLCAPEYAYGESGSPPTIGKNATLRFEIEGLNIEPPHQTIAERIESATKSKEEGNALFKEKKFEEATDCYRQGIKTLDYRWGATPVEEKNIETLRVILNSNAAMCSLKTNNLEQAVNFCNTAIELDPFNTKALYRLSEAYIGLSNFEKAHEVINKCLEINPDDALFKRQAAICKKKEKDFKASEKKMYAKMFS